MTMIVITVVPPRILNTILRNPANSGSQTAHRVSQDPRDMHLDCELTPMAIFLQWRSPAWSTWSTWPIGASWAICPSDGGTRCGCRTGHPVVVGVRCIRARLLPKGVLRHGRFSDRDAIFEQGDVDRNTAVAQETICRRHTFKRRDADLVEM
jgi:hypothetical protein